MLTGEIEEVAVRHPSPAMTKADQRVAVALLGMFHDRPQRRVQTGAVTASGEHADAHT